MTFVSITLIVTGLLIFQSQLSYARIAGETLQGRLHQICR